MKTTTSNASSQPRALVYSSHLSTMGSWSRLALGLAHTLNRLMPTDLATPTHVSAHVGQWASGFNLVRYEREMAKDYDLLWNVDIFSYAEPLAKRNLAWVIAPHYNNVPPPDFELFAISEYVQSLIERFWKRISQRLYPWVPAFPNAVEKERAILHVGRFIRPNDLVDSGQLLAIEQFNALVQEYQAWRWQLVLLSVFVLGHGGFHYGTAAQYRQRPRPTALDWQWSGISRLAESKRRESLMGSDEESIFRFFSTWIPCGRFRRWRSAKPPSSCGDSHRVPS